jgi:16S rRNA (uracil1498-N3)-methyltransferase
LRRRFFVEKFEDDGAALRGEAAHHLGLVLRAQPGQFYELSDGHTVRLGRVERVSRDAIEFTLTDTIPSHESRLTTTLLLSIVKFDRFEWALEKATELGASSVIPVAAARSEKSLVSAAKKRAERWERILLESAQQARRLRPPVLLPIAQPQEICTVAADGERRLSGARIILSELPDAPLLRDVLSKFPREATTEAVLAIGPEGGWADDEFKSATAAGFLQASLGSNILRTETAVAAALASLSFQFE